MTRGIFHSILLENINIHHSFNKYLMNALQQGGINNRVDTLIEKIIWMIGVLRRTVVNNSLSQDSNHPDDLFQSRYVTPGFKPFSY